MEALLASMRAEADAAPMGCVGEGALWSAMALVDWGVKLVVAAYFVARLGAPTSRDARPSSGGRVTDGPSARDHFERGEAEANAHGLELVAQMVEVAVSAANAESALLEDAGGSGGRAVCAAVADYLLTLGSWVSAQRHALCCRFCMRAWTGRMQAMMLGRRRGHGNGTLSCARRLPPCASR